MSLDQGETESDLCVEEQRMPQSLYYLRRNLLFDLRNNLTN